MEVTKWLKPSVKRATNLFRWYGRLPPATGHCTEEAEGSGSSLQRHRCAKVEMVCRPLEQEDSK